MHYLFELFSELAPHPTREGVYIFCRDHFVLAFIVTYILLAVIGAVLASSVTEILHQMRRVIKSPVAKVIAAAGGASGVVLSVLFIFSVRLLLEPIPTFNEGDQRDFLREPVVLNWTYRRQNPDDSVIYEYQNARGQDFSGSISGLSDENSLYSYQDQDEGTRWWRVRAKFSDGSASRWSWPVQTTYYKNSYSRIRDRGELLVYVINSEMQGIFRFLSPQFKLMGADIAIADAVANTLSADLTKKIKTHYVPVAWLGLLKQSEQGNADMIISSITKLPSRESENHIKFSQAYFCTGQSLLYRKADWTTDVPIRDMLKDKTVGYREGTTSGKLVANLVAAAGKDALHPKPFIDGESMLQSLAAPTSSIQMGVTDTPFALDALMRQGIGERLASKPFSKSDYPASVAPEERFEEYALAVAQGEKELLDAINRTIMKLKKDKTLDKILEEAAAAKFPSLAPSIRAQLYASTCPD